MKATLTFTLPEDQEQFQVASRAQDWFFASWELDQWLRGKIKHGMPHKRSDGFYEGLKAARNQLREILDGRGLGLDVLS